MRLIEIFAEQNYDFPTQYALTFLHVASNEGCSNRDLMESTRLSTAAVARNVAALSPYKDRAERQPGYNLIYSEVDPNDARLRCIYLTQHGHDVLARVLEALDAEEEVIEEVEKSGSEAISHEQVPPTRFQVYQKSFGKKSETQENGN